MKYILITLLFLFGCSNPESENIKLINDLQECDTVYLTDTIRIVDTVYITKTTRPIIIENNKLDLSKEVEKLTNQVFKLEEENFQLKSLNESLIPYLTEEYKILFK